MPEKEKIRHLFDAIAPDYDFLNHLLSLDIDRGWRRKAVRSLLDVKEPLSVLDVACGTGDLSFAIAEKSCPGGRVTGIDISERMLSAGREKAASRNFPVPVELIQGDAEHIPFPDASFDRISAAFGVRNFENLKKGLEEMYRVLKPGGKAVILELSVPSGKILSALYRFYFLKILPAVGGMVSGNRGAYEYLPLSVLKFPKPDKFCGILENCGFCEVKHRALSFGICRMYVGSKPAVRRTAQNK